MSRRAASLTGAVLLVLLVAVALAVVPFDVQPGAHPAVDVLRDFSPAQIAREDAFHAALRPWSYGSLLIGLVVYAVLGGTPLGARLVGALPGRWPVQALLATVGTGLLVRLVSLPADVRAEQVLRRYGLSTQGWPAWVEDALKGVLVAGLLSGLGVLVVLALARRMPRSWWAWAAGAVALLAVAGSFVYPVVVEPVFNSFRSLPAGTLRSDLLALASRDGVPVSDVLVADASRRTTAENAYVSGFGSTRRIVLYDTLLRSSTPREVEVVVAHELGHAKRDDVLRGTLLGALGGAAAICLLALLLTWPALLRRAGVSGPGDVRVVPLVVALSAFGTLAVAPATNLVSRRIEARADLHALELTGDVPTFIADQRKLALSNLSDLSPGPLVVAFFADHPAAPERIAMARALEAGRR